MSWNFSALWFVKDLKKFLYELTRVTDKVIFLSVPNRSGIGYLTQKYSGKKDMKKYLIEKNRRILVHNGDIVHSGEKLTDGQLSSHDVLRIMGIKALHNFSA